MQDFKCKICAGTMTVDRSAGIGICDYCGTKQVLPQFSDDSSKRLFDSGNNYLQHSEYDKAENVFNQLLSINPQDAEIFWSLVLCKYGVSFVKDSRTGKYIPTCNRTNYESVLKDKNYLNAIKYSNDEKNIFYREQAEIINKIQKGIIEISKKEKPYDIFISYKELDENGKRTPDSIAAQDLYNKLIAKGYKVFFSRITLENKVGTEFEPYIFAALTTSTVMLTVSSSKKNIEAAWVKNEWIRFLTMIRGNLHKKLIPLYFDMEKNDLPDEFSMFSAINMHEDDFEQEFFRGLEKIVKRPGASNVYRKRAAILSIISVIMVSGIGLGIVLFGDEKGKQTEIIDTSSVENSIKHESDTSEKLTPEEINNEENYKKAVTLYNEYKYAHASFEFAKLGDYSDSKEMLEKAILSWRKVVSTPISDDNDRYSNGLYHINTNGTVDSLTGHKGNAANNLDIMKHGKIVSISSGADGEHIYALHEDGYVSNAVLNNGLQSEWDDIVKISPKMWNTNIALKKDGSILYGELGPEETWIEPINKWSDIVDFEFNVRSNDLMEPYGVIIGVKSDGTLCGVANILDTVDIWDLESDFEKIKLKSNEFEQTGLNEILSQFSDVKKVVSELIYDKDMDCFTLNIFALTYDNRIQSYRKGVYNESAFSDMIDVFSVKYALKQNGDVIEMETGKVIYHDIVYGYSSDRILSFITKTGTIIEYVDCLAEIIVTDDKVYVFDEWKNRLN